MAKNNTVVMASDMGYVWGVWLLVASMRMSGMDEPVLVGCSGWNDNWTKVITSFPDVSLLPMPPEDKRNMTCSKPILMMAPKTEFSTWVDCDGIFSGNCSDVLMDNSPEREQVIYLRRRTPGELQDLYKKERQPGDPPGEIPPCVLDVWRKDVGDLEVPRRKYGCSTGVISVHERWKPFIRRWREQIEKVLPSDVGVVTKGSIGYFQTDDSVLNSLLVFAKDAPQVTTTYRANDASRPHFIHYGWNPKPWVMWNPRSIGWFDKTVSVVEWAFEQGYKPEAPLPYTLKRKNYAICKLLSPLAANVQRLRKLRKKLGF